MRVGGVRQDLFVELKHETQAAVTSAFTTAGSMRCKLLVALKARSGRSRMVDHHEDATGLQGREDLAIERRDAGWPHEADVQVVVVLADENRIQPIGQHHRVDRGR